MERKKYISKKKQKLIDEYQKTPVVIGDQVAVDYMVLHPNETWNTSKNGKSEWGKVVGFDGGDLILELDYYGSSQPRVTIKPEFVQTKYVRCIGENPFESDNTDVRFVSFSLDSIISALDLDDEKGIVRQPYVIGGVTVMELNWNPYIFNKNGEKEYYQRPFVWSLKDKQLLIDSIYNGIECGRILVRHRSWSEVEKLVASGEKEVAFRDIVDGKQRLNAIKCFINDEFKDSYGNYYSDLSEQAQHSFANNRLLAYAEMGERTSDEKVIKQFLKLNFTGRPQSAEHINHVKEIMKKL